MRCAPAIVLRASSSVRQGIRQLEHIPEGINVVVIREHDGEVLYYVFGGETLRSQLSTADSVADLASALDLDSLAPAIADQLESAMLAGTVALEGREVVGVLEVVGGLLDDVAIPQRIDTDSPRHTRVGRIRDVEPLQRIDVDSPQHTRVGRIRDVDPLQRVDVDSPQHTRVGRIRDVDPPRPTVVPGPPADPHPKPGLFRAYPDVDAPGQVGTGETFTVTVGFSTGPRAADADRRPADHRP